MSLIYRCKCCSGAHLAPSTVLQEAEFYSLPISVPSNPVRYVCPFTRKAEDYTDQDHLWIEETHLDDLCAHLLRWMDKTGQTVSTSPR